MVSSDIQKKSGLVAPLPVVRIVPLQPHCFAFGGFEIQMIAAMEAARSAGVDAAPLDFWKREPNFDVLHFWGLELQHKNTIQWAHKAHKKIVVTALTNYPGWSSWLRHLASSLVGPARLRRPMLPLIDCVTVVNQAQAQYLTNTVGFPSEKVAIVPNVVEDIFFQFDESKHGGAYGLVDYVFCAGNICERKNQLALATACGTLGVPLLLVGKVLPGEEDYGQAVAKAMSNSRDMVWIQELGAASVELVEAFRGAALFALPSHLEQQPISALEAAVLGKPLLLGDRPYAKQEYYEGAALAEPRSVKAIAHALRKVMDQPEAHSPARLILEQCRRESVGSKYASIYERLSQES